MSQTPTTPEPPGDMVIVAWRPHPGCGGTARASLFAGFTPIDLATPAPPG